MSVKLTKLHICAHVSKHMHEYTPVCSYHIMRCAYVCAFFAICAHAHAHVSILYVVSAAVERVAEC